MSDEFYGTKFVFSNAAWMISAANGSLSAVSSMLIMSIILRLSPESRTSAYHIIMFFMSFWDTITSVAIALTTIPMPSDVHDVYPFAGKAFGSVGTCEAQGFFIWMGTLFVLCSNTTLNVYYVCTLRYGMIEETFKRFVLPLMLVLSIAVSITMPTAVLRMDLYNPSPFRNYCMFASYPDGCDLDYDENEATKDSIECIRGWDWKTFQSFRAPGLTFIGTALFILVFSLLLVISTVAHAESVIRRSRRIQRRLEMDGRARSRATFQEIEFKRTRNICIQALMYISAFLLTWVWTIILMARRNKYSSEGGPNNVIAFLSVFLVPLQGFFNAAIFVYQKAHVFCQANSRVTFFQAFILVILSPSTVPEVLVSQIEIVHEEGRFRLRRNSLHRGQASLNQSQHIDDALSSIIGAIYDDAELPPSVNIVAN